MKNIDEQGRFKSSKHLDLPPDRVRLNVSRPENWPGLLLIADAYEGTDPEFSTALRTRITALSPNPKVNYAGKKQGHPDGDYSYFCGSEYCRCTS